MIATGIDWATVTHGLDAEGCARIPNVLDAAACEALIAGYAEDEPFRSTVRMEHYNFGRGEYRYYAYPLPGEVARLRAMFYGHLASLANHWNALLGGGERYPAGLDEYVAACAAAGQKRPTPLILRYQAGDYNALHQDIYGERAFPLQLTVYLSDRSGYAGGETILTFGRPRAQTVARALTFERGDALVFPNRYRPVPNARGSHYRENIRHGVSVLGSGERYALGIPFHDAR